MSDKKNQADKHKSVYRTPGALKGRIKIPDDFDAPMSEEELALWYDAPIFPEDETHNDQAGG